MLKSKVVSSINNDYYLAGKEMIQEVYKEMTDIKIGFYFTSENVNIKEVLNGINYKKNIPIIGCTSSKCILTNDGIISSENGFNGLLTLSDKKMKVGIACHQSGNDARVIGRKVAIEAIEDAQTTRAPAYIYMIASPKEEEEYLMGIEDVVGRVPIFGGSAADDNIDNKWKIICKDKIINDGIAVAFIYADNEIVTSFSGEYTPTDNIGIVTEVENNRNLISIDGISALRKYSNWVKVSPQKLKGRNILLQSITKPLGIRDSLGNIDLIKYPIFGNDMGTKIIADDTILMGNKVVKGTAILQLEATEKELRDAPIKLIKKTKEKLYTNPAAYILIHCAARRNMIEKDLNEIYNELKKETKGVPFIMPFTFGQYGYEEHSANMCGGLMLSFTIFGED